VNFFGFIDYDLQRDMEQWNKFIFFWKKNTNSSVRQSHNNLAWDDVMWHIIKTKKLVVVDVPITSNKNTLWDYLIQEGL